MRYRFFASLLVALPLVAQSQTATQEKEFTPQVGQAGKDVIWVPTPEGLVEKMLTMAKVTPRDFVMDLGSGDGRTVIAAAKKFGANAMGIEYNPDMVALSTKNAQAAGVSDKVKFVKADLFETDFSKAQVITMYLLPDINLRLRPKLLEMKPGTRIVSHAFSMGEWDPDERAEVDNRTAMLWIVPAKVAGNWTLAHPAGNGTASYDVTLAQSFQKLGGTVKQGNYTTTIQNGSLRGDEAQFTFADASGTKRRFVGRVSDNKMEGELDSGNLAAMRWQATKK